MPENAEHRQAQWKQLTATEITRYQLQDTNADTTTFWSVMERLSNAAKNGKKEHTLFPTQRKQRRPE